MNIDTEEKPEKDESKIVFLGDADPEIRKVLLYGEVNETSAKDIVGTMIFLHETAEVELPEDPEDEESELTKTVKPFEMIISTNGGNADDMFSIYDMMNFVKKDVDIHTLGIGKVMSAGVLLLASGTKGKRRIGQNCRVMIHSVIGGHSGPIHQINNEFKEIEHIQDMYISALAKETNMSIKQIRKFYKNKINVYFSADQAIELGIADEII